MSQSKKAIDTFRNTLGSATPTGQLLMGTVSGLVTGYVTTKIGKKVSFIAGGGIIVYQIAQSKGLVSLTWEQMREKAQNAQKNNTKGAELFNKVKSFSKNNPPFTAGFIGGFLIGASTM